MRKEINLSSCVSIQHFPDASSQFAVRENIAYSPFVYSLKQKYAALCSLGILVYYSNMKIC